MKFNFDRDAMIREISIAQEIITNKSPVSILSNILLIAEENKLTIKATDSTIKFTTCIPVDVETEGKTTIYCFTFMNILTSLPSGEVEFNQEDLVVTIKPISKKIKFQLKSQTSDKFPEFPLTNQLPFFEIPAKDFKEMIRQTIFSVSEDKNRYFMTGIYFVKENDILTMVATDGRRLSCISKNFDVPEFSPSIIPPKVLSCILKNASDEGNIQIAVVEKSIFIKTGNFEFSSVLIDGQFPNYKKVIPENLNNLISVNKNDFDSALKRMMILVDRKVCRILFKIMPGVMKISSPESENGAADEEIPCKYDGENIVMALNYSYISDPLKVIDSENILIEFNVSENKNDEGDGIISKALILKSDPAKDYFHVVMPMNF